MSNRERVCSLRAWKGEKKTIETMQIQRNAALPGIFGAVRLFLTNLSTLMTLLPPGPRDRMGWLAAAGPRGGLFQCTFVSIIHPLLRIALLIGTKAHNIKPDKSHDDI